MGHPSKQDADKKSDKSSRREKEKPVKDTDDKIVKEKSTKSRQNTHEMSEAGSTAGANQERDPPAGGEPTNDKQPDPVAGGSGANEEQDDGSKAFLNFFKAYGPMGFVPPPGTPFLPPHMAFPFWMNPYMDDSYPEQGQDGAGLADSVYSAADLVDKGHDAPVAQGEKVNKPQSQPAATLSAPKQTTPETTQAETTPPTRAEFDLENLPDNEYGQLIRQRQEKRANQNRVGPALGQNVAALLDSTLADKITVKELKETVEKYPHPANTYRLVVPELEPEVDKFIDTLTKDTAKVSIYCLYTNIGRYIYTIFSVGSSHCVFNIMFCLVEHDIKVVLALFEGDSGGR